MAHFAQLDNTNIVTSVIVVHNSILMDGAGTENEDLGINFCRQLYGLDTNWKQTSYNANFRKNFATIGSTYDPVRDAFVPVSPYPSWVLNEETCNWIPPLPYPTDGKRYYWDEPSVSWMEVPNADSPGSN